MHVLPLHMRACVWVCGWMRGGGGLSGCTCAWADGRGGAARAGRVLAWVHAVARVSSAHAALAAHPAPPPQPANCRWTTCQSAPECQQPVRNRPTLLLPPLCPGAERGRDGVGPGLARVQSRLIIVARELAAEPVGACVAAAAPLPPLRIKAERIWWSARPRPLQLTMVTQGTLSRLQVRPPGLPLAGLHLLLPSCGLRARPVGPFSGRPRGAVGRAGASERATRRRASRGAGSAPRPCRVVSTIATPQHPQCSALPAALLRRCAIPATWQ